MNTQVVFSVIIPVYNTQKTLRECVDSVLLQSHKNIELILVDDGSTDNSPRLCDELADSDNRIKVIHKRNGGLSSARNAGMNEISGDYFLFLDSDDYWIYNEFLSDLASVIEKADSDVAIFKYTSDKSLIDSDKRNTESENKINSQEKAAAFRELILSDRLQSSACNKAFRSSVFNNDSFRFVEGIYSEDIDWIARVMIKAEKIAFLDRFAYYYRPNESSITHNIRYKNVNDLCNNIKKVVEFSEPIKDEGYYEWYMNYCAYQFITFLYNAATYKGEESISSEIAELKQYAYLLKYHHNKKVKLCYLFNKCFGYRLTIKILKIFLKFRG